MTPHNLETVRRAADKALSEAPYNRDVMIAQIYTMLATLLQHEADKAADRR